MRFIAEVNIDIVNLGAFLRLVAASTAFLVQQVQSTNHVNSHRIKTLRNKLGK